MKKILAGLLTVLVLASLLIITIQAENATLPSSVADTPSLVTERWGANSTAEYPANAIDTTLNGLHPDWSADNSDTLKIRSGGGFDAWALVYFDVANLPVTTTIRSASLHLYTHAHCTCDVYETVHQILDPDALGLWDEDDATFNRRQSGVPWSNTAPGDLNTVIGPELDRAYFGTHSQWSYFWAEWDVTTAVQEWVADPAANSGLLLPHIEDALYTADSSESANAELRPYLQITYEGPNPNRPAQASGLDVFHNSGQTFITWDEVGSGDPPSDDAYRVYRHDAPITASNLDDATLLAQVPAGSGYYEHEDVGCSNGSDCSPIGQTRFIIEDDGDPLPEGRGLFVYTVHDDQGIQNRSEGIAKSPTPAWIWRSRQSNYGNGAFYYAVTSLVEDNENRQAFSSENALTVGVSEGEATPQPVRVWTNGTGTGWVYTQFMDYHDWNPTYEDYAYNFYVGVPPGYGVGGNSWPLLVQLHAYTGSYRLPWSTSAGTDYDWPTIQVFPDDRSNTWWYGFGEMVGHEAPLDDGLIVNYTEQRVEQIMDWVISQFNVDLNRVYLWGGSMGGSGTLEFGLRRGDLFAAIYAESAMTDFAASGDAGGADWVSDVDERWGTPEENIATSHGPGIWDWYNLQDWVSDNPGVELPFLADHHGQNDNTIDWETQGLPWYPALEEGQHGFVGVFDGAGHGWPGFVADHANFTLENFDFVKDESFPAFANASNSDDPATSTGCRNCRLEWSSAANNFAGPPTDTADLYELVIRTNDGSDATVDVTPRRLQQFVVTAGHSYAWQNERVSDSVVAQSGTVIADEHGLITVPAFVVSASGNRLRLGSFEPGETTTPSTTPTLTPTPTITPTPTPTSTGAPAPNDPCAPLPPPTGPTITVSTVTELQSAVNSAAPGDTILVTDGTYNLNGVYLWFDVPNVTLRSASGDRESVILDGNYTTTEIVQIVSSNVTIADLTLREAYYHPIHVMSTSSADTTGTLIYNVHIVDPGEQAIKINPYTGENALYFPDDGIIACSHIELTDAGRPHIRNNCYTGGVDAHQSRDWVIRDNLIEGFWCDSGLSEHGIHLWRSCRDTLVERNELRNNARGIGFGLTTSGAGVRTYPDDPCPDAGGGYVDHYGGIIRNNFVFANDDELFASDYGFDCGICLWQACGAQVLHNTVASTQAPFSSIEWRFDHTDVDIINNLVSHNLMDRGGTASLDGNLENQSLSLFVDGANGDLHLAETADAAIDNGVLLSAGLCDDDFDGDTRPIGPAPDVGGDEFGAPSPTPTPTATPSLPPCNLEGDVDGDVDITGVMLVASLWHSAAGDPDYNADYDLDDSGVIDIVDIMLVAVHWGEDCTTPTPTPTPTATATATPTITPTPTPTTTPGTLDVALTVTDDAGVARVSAPVTSGVPLPRAANVTDIAQLQLTAGGQPVPAQFTPLARWGGAPDDTSKPIKWVLVDFQADAEANSSAIYHLTLADVGGSSRFRGISVLESPTCWGCGVATPNKFGAPLEIDTGVARFVISETAFGLFEQIYLDRDDDGEVDDALLASPGEIMATAGGVTYRADTSAPSEVTVEMMGELHTVIRVRGHLRSASDDKLLAYTARLHFYAGQPAARVMFTVWNDNPMVNDGTGQPDIKAFGSPNTVLFEDLSLSLQLANASSPTYILAGGPGETWSGALTDAAQLYQDSSGGPQWNHAPDNTANTFRGFQAQANGATLHAACTEADDEDTCRSRGWGGLLASDGAIVAGVRHFWQNYPKAVALSADGTVTVGLFPGDYSQDFELRVGEQKTHEVLFYFGAEDTTDRMTALHKRARAWASSEYYLDEAGVFDRAAPHNATAFPDFEGYVDAAILYDQMNLLWLRDGGVDSGWVYSPRPEAWGWRNFGDTIAEDETNGDGYPVFTNQQYDHPWVAILQMIRSLNVGGGRPDLWWQLAESGARHQADVDVIHSLCSGWPPDQMVACMDVEQGPPYITGWAMGGRLTNQHHADPSPNLHRHALIDYWSGGIRGMLYYYYLTGDGTVQDAWLEMAENARWKVDNSPCDPSCGPGYAQNNPGEGDGRAPAYALEILTDAYAATGDTAYLTSAQDVVAESHPDNTWFGQPGFTLDPNVSPSGRQTSPWGLGMIMKSLGRYLDMTAEWTGMPDPTAQDSLLRYAELQANWWRLGEDEPSCYYIGENGGCTPQAQNDFLADGLAWGLIYDDGGADRTLWETVAADAWQKSEDEPWGPEYSKDTFLTAKTHFMHANNGVAWMRYALEGGSQLLQPSDLIYRGTFAYPAGDDGLASHAWAYSGHALAYYPEGDASGPADGYPGSLYAAGHAWYDLVGEITVPEPAIADNFDDLPQASVLRSLTDITGGWKDNCTYNDDCIYREVDGLAYLPNVSQIAWNLRDWYNAAGYDQDSLGWSELDMTGAQGVWHIGERGNDVFHNARTCDYLFTAPDSFAGENLDGKWLIAGNHRGAGAFGGSQGPTLYALAPWEDGTPPASGQNLDALALVYYPMIYPDCLDNPDECYFPNYRAKDDWGGGVWVQTTDKSGILIFGRKGLGDNCYGTQAECGGDPCDMYKGYHAYPYEPQILFYDPEALNDVLAGTSEQWEVLPYAVYRPLDEVLDGECAPLGAAAYDQESGTIYATEREAGPWGETVVHVWEVGD